MRPDRVTMAFLVAAAVAWTAPGAIVAGAAAPAAPATVTIAYQPGIGYATLLVIKAQHTLEKQFPGTSFAWTLLANGATIRTGMIAGQIQFGAGGVAPFLIGWDRGAGLRLVAAMNEMNLWLVTLDPSVRTLRDLKPGMKIGMPGVDSIQAIVLRKAAERAFGNAHALDTGIVSIEHPVGVQALLHGQLTAHLSSPPFQFEEVAAGGRIILRSYDLFGESTFNSVFTTDKIAAQYPPLVDAMSRDLTEATAFINSHPREAAAILSADAHGKPGTEEFLGWMTRPGVRYTTVPHGFGAYAAFMHSIGLLSKVPASMCEIELPALRCGGS
ncbi:MAG TPA: ABC transporter substrate-binding protein [bacterium]|nr:ABC transporter substrate-binding protein [bacterium]